MSAPKLIADSGSTKTDWCLLSANQNSYFRTQGLNPYYLEATHIQVILENELLPQIPQKPSSIIFYGSGCSLPEKQTIIQKALSDAFGGLVAVEVQHDLLGAARALCGHEAGIACILGTGSNACVFDGQNIVKEAVNLGFWLGDEGGAGHLGKQVITDFLYGKLAGSPLHAHLLQMGLTRENVLEMAYKRPSPNTHFAQYAKVLSTFQEEAYCQKLIHNTLTQFLQNHVLPFEQKDYPVHFTGSVAKYLAKELALVMQEQGLKMGRIVQKPIDGLVAYHQA